MSMDVLFAVMDVCCHDSDCCIYKSGNHQGTVKAALFYDIFPFTVCERCDISEKFGTFGNICHQIQKVHNSGKTKSDAHAASVKESGKSKADTGQLHLQEIVCQMEKQELLPWNCFFDHSDGA